MLQFVQRVTEKSICISTRTYSAMILNNFTNMIYRKEHLYSIGKKLKNRWQTKRVIFVPNNFVTSFRRTWPYQLT